MELNRLILVLFGLVFYATVVHGQEEILAAMASLQANVQDEVEPKGRPFPKIRGPKCLNSKIGIVGAGPSGVHMAYELKKLGYEDVTILEKNDYIGGKSFNLEYRGLKQGLTTQYITTEYEDNLIPLLEKFGLLGENKFSVFTPGSAIWLENNPDVSIWLRANKKATHHAEGLVIQFNYSIIQSMQEGSGPIDTNTEAVLYAMQTLGASDPTAAFLMILDAAKRYVDFHKELFGTYKYQVESIYCLYRVNIRISNAMSQ
jgi:hypothetical protein